MMNSNCSFYNSPKATAQQLRNELDISNDIKINFDEVYQALGIRLRIAELKQKVLGACKVVGLNKLVVISSSIKYETQKRFTLAHELGHVVLHHGASQCTADDLEFSYKNITSKEKEANHFAAAFLLPPSIVDKRLKRSEVTFAIAKELSETYGISLTSTLISLVHATSDSVCLFIQSNGMIVYSVSSSSCTFIPREGWVQDDVGINIVSPDGITIRKNSDYESWFEPNPIADEIICTEESQLFNKLGTAISIVSVYTDS